MLTSLWWQQTCPDQAAQHPSIHPSLCACPNLWSPNSSPIQMCFNTVLLQSAEMLSYSCIKPAVCWARPHKLTFFSFNTWKKTAKAMPSLNGLDILMHLIYSEQKVAKLEGLSGFFHYKLYIESFISQLQIAVGWNLATWFLTKSAFLFYFLKFFWCPFLYYAYIKKQWSAAGDAFAILM